jgi:predicted unusual protein kinase regulating ubiquinone biosynthesis (AarF/ABC1/UbiB family)
MSVVDISSEKAGAVESDSAPMFVSDTSESRSIKSGDQRQAPLRPRSLLSRRFRIAVFFLRMGIHFLWWDWILRWPLLRTFRTPWIPRWRRVTRRYKRVALDLQGLWVKLGQFLSTRVDVLPMEITGELESLRDEVPPVNGEAVIAQIEADLDRPIEQIFASVSPHPIGSASLAQVHCAQTLSGEAVVVKVLRPGIREIIRDDMKLLRHAATWLKRVKAISDRADVDAIVAEVDTVTTGELDLREEAKNVDRFTDDFAGDPGVAAPRIYGAESSAGTLTMEDVSYIPIGDVEALDRAGIDRKSVARKIYEIYLTQFFVTYRIHADPHPGNLFVRPLPTVTGKLANPRAEFKPGDPVPYAPQRPFQLVVVDFGMVVEMPPALREGLREFAIGLGTRDARRILESYSKLGVLRPGANLDFVEVMLQEQLDNFWGSFIGQMRQKDLTRPAVRAFLHKYEELMASAPFQFRSEMLFMSRAMGILSGLTYNLDPEFDPWNATAPFAQKLIQEDIGKALRRTVEDVVAGRPPTTLGPLLRFLPGASRSPRPAAAMDAANTAEIRRLRKSVHRLTTLVVVAGIVAVGAALESTGVRISHLVLLPWPMENLERWLLEAAGIVLIFRFLRRSS